MPIPRQPNPFRNQPPLLTSGSCASNPQNRQRVASALICSAHLGHVLVSLVSSTHNPPCSPGLEPGRLICANTGTRPHVFPRGCFISWAARHSGLPVFRRKYALRWEITPKRTFYLGLFR